MTEINKKLDLAAIPPTNNDGDPYILPLDIYKEGYQAYNISNWFKGRVGDNGTPFAIRWYSHGRLLNIQGMRPFIEGQVGDYTIDDSDPDNIRIDMAEDASNIHIVGDVDDTQAGGVAIYRLISQAFPKSGIFYGKIGFMGTQDDGTLVNTGVDIVFKVLAGHMEMMSARKFYVTELEKAWLEMQAKFKQYNQEYKDTTTKQAEQFKADTEKALADLNTKIANEIKRAEDTLNESTLDLTSLVNNLKNLSFSVQTLQSQINTLGLETSTDHERDVHNLENKIQSLFSDISYAPEVYLDLNAVSSAYPNGSKKLIITSDGKTAIWDGSKWIAGSAYQAVGLSDQEVRDNHIQSINLQNIVNSYATKGKAKVWKPSTSPISGYNIYYNNNEVALNKTDATRNDFGILFPVKLDRLPQANENLYIDLTYWTSNNDNLDDRVDVYLWGTDNNPIKQYWYGGKASGIVHVAVPKADFDQYKINNEFNVLVALHGGAGSIDIVNFRASYDSDNGSLTDKIVNLSPLTRTNGFKINQAVLWPSRTDTTKKLYFSENLAAVSYDDTIKQSQGLEFIGDIDSTLTNYLSFKCEILGENDLSMIISADGSTPSNQGVISHNQGFQEVAFKLTPEDCKSLGITNKIHIIIGGNGFKIIAVQNLRISPFASSAKAINAINDNQYCRIYNDLSPWKTLTCTEKKFGLNLDAFANADKSNVNGLIYGTVGEPDQIDGKLKSVNLYATQAGSTNICVAKVDQNGLLIDSRKYNINYQAGVNHFDYSDQNIDVPEGAQVFVDLSSLGLFENTNNIPLYSDFQIQTTDHTSTNPNYPGNPLYMTDKMIPFNYTVADPTVYQQVDDLRNQVKDVKDQVSDNSVNITKNSKRILTAPNGTKFKLTVGNDGSLTAVSTIPKKMTIFGNSLTLIHDMGLAASDQNHDYYHYITEYAKNANPDVKFNPRINVSPWEMASTNAERLDKFNELIKPLLSADTDIVVIQLGDNVNHWTGDADFETGAQQLLANVRSVSPKAEIYWAAACFIPFPDIIADIQTACHKYGAHFIDIRDICQNHHAKIGDVETLPDGTKYTLVNSGEAQHPNDEGMKLIAEAIENQFDF